MSRHQQTGLAVIQHFGNAAHPGRHDHASRLARLAQHQSGRLVVRCQRKHVGLRKISTRVGNKAFEVRLPGNPKLPGERFHRRAIGPIADEIQHRVRHALAQQREGAQQIADTLAFIHARHRDDARMRQLRRRGNRHAG